MPTSGVPGWLIFVGSTLVALVFAVGLVVLLVLGHPVPDQLWVLTGVIATAYFGSGPFSVAHQSVSATNRNLIETVNHAIATLHDAIAGISNQTGASITATTSPGEPAPPP